MAELGLNALPNVIRHDGLVFPVVNLVLVLNLADVGNVREQVPEAVLVEWPAASPRPFARRPFFVSPPAAIEFLHNRKQPLVLKI